MYKWLNCEFSFFFLIYKLLISPRDKDKQHVSKRHLARQEMTWLAAQITQLCVLLRWMCTEVQRLQSSNRKFTKFIRFLMNNSAVKHIFLFFTCRKAFWGCVRVCARSCMQSTSSLFFFKSNFTLCAHVLYHSDGEEKTTTKDSRVVLGRQQGVTVGGFYPSSCFDFSPEQTKAAEIRVLLCCRVVVLSAASCGRTYAPAQPASSSSPWGLDISAETH